MKGKRGPKNLNVKNIEISVDKKTGVITMFNDGNGIDVEKHPSIRYGFRNDFWTSKNIYKL